MINNTPYYYISKYRAELMGIAILWVVWYHSPFKIDFFPIAAINAAFGSVKAVGYGGVDIFFLVSGLGIYRSLQRHNISTYIKNRFKKILPVWWSYVVIVVIISAIVFHVRYKISEVIGCITFTGLWLNMEHQGNWYVYAIMLLYLIAPLFFFIIKESKNKRKTSLLLILILLFISFSFIGNFELIAFSRFPTFIIGMYFCAALQERQMNKKNWMHCFLCVAAGIGVLLVMRSLLSGDTIWHYGLFWYPFIIIAPALSLLVAKLFDKNPKGTKPLRWVLRQCGMASFEILLVSDFFFNNDLANSISLLNNMPKSVVNLVITLVAIIMGFGFNKIIELIKSLFFQKNTP